MDESRRLRSKDVKETALSIKADIVKSDKRLKCPHCDKKGHNKDKCWKKYPEKKSKRAKNSEKQEIEDHEEVTLFAAHESLFYNDNKEKDHIQWILDSGATSHICSDRALFSELEPYSISLRWGTASQIKTSGKGIINIKFNGYPVRITECLFVPEIGVNLLSLGALIEKGLSIEFTQESIKISKNNKSFAIGFFQNKLPIFYTSKNEQNLLLIQKENPEIWHKRLAHVGSTALEKLPNAVIGCEFSGEKGHGPISKNNPCDICIRAKMTQTISREPSSTVKKFLERIHTDICGLINPNTFSGYKYIGTFIDVATRYAEIVLLKTKDDIFDKFKEFVIREENQMELKLKRLHSDNGLEFKNAKFDQFLKEKGAIATFSAPYAHEQNGLAEIFNRTLLNKIRALLIESGLPNSYWAEAANTATFIYNRTPHSSKNFVTPYELKYNEKPDISSLKIWGSMAYKKDYLVKKLDPRASIGILVGYGSNQWRILDPTSKKVTWARDVIIKEGHFLKNRDDLSPD